VGDLFNPLFPLRRFPFLDKEGVFEYSLISKEALAMAWEIRIRIVLAES
jgi:hypothetical protein